MKRSIITIVLLAISISVQGQTFYSDADPENAKAMDFVRTQIAESLDAIYEKKDVRTNEDGDRITIWVYSTEYESNFTVQLAVKKITRSYSDVEVLTPWERSVNGGIMLSLIFTNGDASHAIFISFNEETDRLHFLM